MMFDRLPEELLKELSDFLNLKHEVSFSLINRKFNEQFRLNLLRRLDAILSKNEKVFFSHLLHFVQKNEKDGLAILKDPFCKNILIEERPKQLPHWMLGIAECQPVLMPFLLNDNDYKNSLSPEEFEYLMQNYSAIKVFVEKHQITPPIAIDTRQEDDELEIDDSIGSLNI